MELQSPLFHIEVCNLLHNSGNLSRKVWVRRGILVDRWISRKYYPSLERYFESLCDWIDDHLSLIEFAYNNSYHSTISSWSSFGRRCRFPIGWFEVDEAGLIGPGLVHQAMEKVKVIQVTLKTAQSRQKSYTDVRIRPLDFEVDDWVYLKVSPIKGVMRFGKKGKLSPGTLDLI